MSDGDQGVYIINAQYIIYLRASKEAKPHLVDENYFMTRTN